MCQVPDLEQGACRPHHQQERQVQVRGLSDCFYDLISSLYCYCCYYDVAVLVLCAKHQTPARSLQARPSARTTSSSECHMLCHVCRIVSAISICSLQSLAGCPIGKDDSRKQARNHGVVLQVCCGAM
jgi:hypothetical protein